MTEFHEVRINIQFNETKGFMEVSKVTSSVRKGNKHTRKEFTERPSMDHLCDFLAMMESRKGPAKIHTTYTQSDGSTLPKEWLR